jgi:hypothetical protein
MERHTNAVLMCFLLMSLLLKKVRFTATFPVPVRTRRTEARLTVGRVREAWHEA